MTNFTLFVLAPAAIAFLTGHLVRHKESVLGYFGAGYLGMQLSGGLRYATGIQPIQSIGSLDPMLWIFGSTCIVMACARLLNRKAKPRPA